MIDRVLIDTLNLRSRDFAFKWKDLVRKNEQLKHYNTLDDAVLIEADEGTYSLLARTLDRGYDRLMIEDYFTQAGKHRMHEGFPLSEVMFALSLAQKTVIEYLMTEFAPENPMRMYQAMEALTKIADFFMLASFYVSKGFLQEMYTKMRHHDKLSDELLKKYLREDFFFKDK